MTRFYFIIFNCHYICYKISNHFYNFYSNLIIHLMKLCVFVTDCFLIASNLWWKD